tara:strand:- start:5 stop:325 length:321 start_codon:yes stop_codon:yes gene_type:complete
VRKQFPFEDLKYSRPSLRLQWPDIIQLLRENGEEIGDYDDISTTQEKLLGKLIKEKHGVDFYLVDKFPIDSKFLKMPPISWSDFSSYLRNNTHFFFFNSSSFLHDD